MLLSLLFAAVASSIACNLFSSDSSPSTPSPMVTTDSYSGPIAQNSAAVFTFTVTTAGNVSVTLTAVTPPTSGALGLGLGTPASGNSCTVTSSTSSAVAGTSAQLTSTENPGSYCVKVFDPGTLTQTSTVAISIAHP
jgi:hypothetical protein